jgi:hypothetical protein
MHGQRGFLIEIMSGTLATLRFETGCRAVGQCAKECLHGYP